MPLVFVHGVSVREGKSYSENQKTRDGLFRKYALKKLVPDSDKALIENPYWGQLGANPAWNSASRSRWPVIVPRTDPGMSPAPALLPTWQLRADIGVFGSLFD